MIQNRRTNMLIPWYQNSITTNFWIMKINKNQPGKKTSVVSYSISLPRTQLETIPVKRNFDQSTNLLNGNDASQKVRRRYSFDDNGGGYLGL